MSYIYNKETHTDYSNDYMNNLGIDAETQDSILAMRDYDYQKLAAKEQEWVRVQLSYLDELEKKLRDGDSRATMTEEEIVNHRKELRDYVTNDNSVLSVNGNRPLVD